MLKDYSVPFYSNTPDNTHCFQAALKMVIEFFLPEKKLTFEELDVITAKKKDLYTWPMAAMIWLQEQGFKVIDIEVFDYERFIKEGGNYLIDEYGKEVGELQIKVSDIKNEQKLAKEFLTKVKIDKRLPTINDIKKLLDENNLIICNINACALYDLPGYSGHIVVIKGYTENELIVHDPGLPSHENKKFSYNAFMKAWAYPNERALNIVAISR